MEIRITEPSGKQEEDLLAFYRRAYRPDYPLANKRFLRWWLHDNPNFRGNGFSCKIALDGAAIVGHYGYVPVWLWAHGERVRAFWGGNLVVDAAYRRRGIGGQLIEALRKEGVMGLDIGASLIAEPMLVKNGWTHMGTLHRWVGILDPARAVDIATDPGAINACALPPLPAAEKQDSVYEIRALERFGADHDFFWQRRRASIACATDRDALHLNWRYADHPVFCYKIFEIRSGGKSEGYAIARKEESRGGTLPITMMRVVEFITFPGFEEPLIRHLIREAKDMDAVLMDFFCASAGFGAAFERYGFKREPWSGKIARLFSPVTLSKFLISFNTVFTDPTRRATMPSQEEWYVTAGDGDQDRPNIVL